MPELTGEKNIDTPWSPPPGFFNKDPRVKELYDLSVKVVHGLDKLTHEKLTKEEEQNLKDKIYESRLQMANLGIHYDMHPDLTNEQYHSDPQLLIERISGQLVGLDPDELTTERESSLLRQEFNELNTPTTFSRSDKLPLKLSRSYGQSFAIGALMQNLGISSEED